MGVADEVSALLISYRDIVESMTITDTPVTSYERQPVRATLKETIYPVVTEKGSPQVSLKYNDGNS